jgi:mercuric ion binding protein
VDFFSLGVIVKPNPSEGGQYMGKKCVAALMILAGIMLFSGFFQGVLAADKTVRLKVPGCTCGDTETMVRTTLQQSTGVKSVTTNPIMGAYEVVFDDTKTNYDQLKRALQQAGYPPVGKPEYLN